MIISEKSDCISVNRAAELLDASRSGYYKWREKSHGTEEEKKSDVAIKEEMQKIVIEFPGYGYRRVKVQIADHGFKSWRKNLSESRQNS
jgi:hypothetical protein